MKKSTEVTRFLNHIEREKTAIKTELNQKISLLKTDLQAEMSAHATAELKLQGAQEKIGVYETEIAALREQNEKLLSASRLLLPKIRVNIYENSTACTPRFFRTGKWWSRETGGLEPDFVTEMTADEIEECVNFYGKTEMQLMLPKSKRHEIEENA
jgi:hypothetical protein